MRASEGKNLEYRSEEMAKLLFPRNVKLLITAPRQDHQLIYFKIKETNYSPVIFFFRNETLANSWIEKLNKPLEIWDIATVFAMHILQKQSSIRLLILDPNPGQDSFLGEQIVSLSSKIIKPEQIDYASLQLFGCTLESS